MTIENPTIAIGLVQTAALAGIFFRLGGLTTGMKSLKTRVSKLEGYHE